MLYQGSRGSRGGFSSPNWMLCSTRHLLPNLGGFSMSSRIRTGSIVQDKRDKLWRFVWWQDGKRRSKALGRFSTKAATPRRPGSKNTKHIWSANCKHAGSAVQGGEDAKAEGHASHVSILDSCPHFAEVGSMPNHGPSGAACRNVVGFTSACT